MNTIKRIPAAIAAAYRAFVSTMRTAGGAVVQGGGGSGPPTLPK